jgi:hypothetical protein
MMSAGRRIRRANKPRKSSGLPRLESQENWNRSINHFSAQRPPSMLICLLWLPGIRFVFWSSAGGSRVDQWDSGGNRCGQSEWYRRLWVLGIRLSDIATVSTQALDLRRVARSKRYLGMASVLRIQWQFACESEDGLSPLVHFNSCSAWSGRFRQTVVFRLESNLKFRGGQL